MAGDNAKVYVLILNWNGWKDTIECLESVFRNDHQDYQVIVCDNASQDGSLEHIKEWATGRRETSYSGPDLLQGLSSPPVAKPLALAEYSREQAEAGGDEEGKNARLVLIQTGANLGFAGGNNVGMRYALARNDFDYIWLLNNDTVILPDALVHLVRRMQERPDAGMCGSTLPYYHHPDRVWALGGATYNRWLAKPRCIGLDLSIPQTIDPLKVEERMAYIAGASLLVSRSFLNSIGLMSEEYFLYFEELDWAVRARGQYSLAYAEKSIVYHKVGASTDSGSSSGNTASLYFMFRNSLLFTLKYFPLALPLVALRTTAIYALKRLGARSKRIIPS
jgi:GT2 family glycosyltransferase